MDNADYNELDTLMRMGTLTFLVKMELALGSIILIGVLCFIRV
jgi:hypothetical protein